MGRTREIRSTPPTLVPHQPDGCCRSVPGSAHPSPDFRLGPRHHSYSCRIDPGSTSPISAQTTKQLPHFLPSHLVFAPMVAAKLPNPPIQTLVIAAVKCDKMGVSQFCSPVFVLEPLAQGFRRTARIDSIVRKNLLPGRPNSDACRAMFSPDGRHVPENLTYVVDWIVQRIDYVFDRRVIWQLSPAFRHFVTSALWQTEDWKSRHR